MIRAIIVDDEENNIRNLEALLAKHCPQVTVVASADHADKAKDLILKLSPEVLFLDIQMPDLNGFELLQSLGDCSFEVIFVTAYDVYGIAAIKFSALDYLLKPVNIKELIAATEKAEQAIKKKKENLRLVNLLDLIGYQALDQDRKIALPTLRETFLVPNRNIIRCESSNNYTIFLLVDGTSIVISKPIYEFEELLTPYDFIRCHQSHLVNKRHVRSILHQDGSYLTFDNSDARVPVSNQKKSAVKAAFGKGQH